ncbi:MAG: EamA family transporter, partial [bacterium]|nr:EamA family transporter [bacterium]
SFSSLITLTYTILYEDYKTIPWHYVPYVYAASLFYILYQIFTSKAYEKGQISKFYPLTVLSPIFIPFWAYLFLGERINVLVGLGILSALVGAILVKANSLTLTEFKKIFTLDTEYIGARFALGASLMYSFGSVLDKSKIAEFSLPSYLAILLTSMTINGFVFYFIRKKNDTRIFPYFGKHWKAIAIAGASLIMSFYTFRIALRAVPVSIAVPVRLVAIIFAILLGVVLLKEKLKPQNLLGSLVIIAGILLINFGI